MMGVIINSVQNDFIITKQLERSGNEKTLLQRVVGKCEPSEAIGEAFGTTLLAIGCTAGAALEALAGERRAALALGALAIGVPAITIARSASNASDAVKMALGTATIVTMFAYPIITGAIALPIISKAILGK